MNEHLERLVDRIMQGNAEAEEIILTELPRQTMEEIARMPDIQYDDFLTILEAEAILSGKRLKGVKELNTVREAMRIRQVRTATPVAELFPEVGCDDLSVPAGYTLTGTGVLDESGEVIATAPFIIAGRAKSPDIGRAEYRILLLETDNGGWTELRSDASRGPAGIVRAVAGAGVFVETKAAVRFAAAWLALNWHYLGVSVDEEMANAYERLVEIVAANTEKFLSERWGRIFAPPDQPDRPFVAIPVAQFEAILRKIGYGQNRTVLLKMWRARGLLRIDGDNRHTASVRVAGVVQRCVVVLLPPDFISVVTSSGRSVVTPQPLSHKGKAAS